MARFGEVPANIDFPGEEEKTLAYWRKENTFQKSLE
jgi:isoleucyl-tRNA synthetase